MGGKFDSKKWSMAVMGMSALMLVWLGSLICGLFKPEVFSNIISLAVPVIGLIGTICSVMVAGQAWVDGKAVVQKPPRMSPTGEATSQPM